MTSQAGDPVLPTVQALPATLWAQPESQGLKSLWVPPAVS